MLLRSLRNRGKEWHLQYHKILKCYKVSTYCLIGRMKVFTLNLLFIYFFQNFTPFPTNATFEGENQGLN